MQFKIFGLIVATAIVLIAEAGWSANFTLFKGSQIPVILGEPDYSPDFPKTKFDFQEAARELYNIHSDINKTKKYRLSQGETFIPSAKTINVSTLSDLELGELQKIVKQSPQLSKEDMGELAPFIQREYEKGRGFLESYRSLKGINQATKVQFCENIESNREAEVLSSVSNRLNFLNEGGVLGSGLCWWHSSFTRAVAGLAIFEPQLPRPKYKQVVDIINRLSKMNEVVVIPGFKDLHSFSQSFKNLIVDKLNSMQNVEILNFETRGLRGSSNNDSVALREQLDRAYVDFSKHKMPVYLMLQVSGVMAHSAVVINMIKRDNGYDLYLMDSAFSGTLVWRYVYGMSEFVYFNDKTFIPYVTTKERYEWIRIKKIAQDYCSKVRAK